MFPYQVRHGLCQLDHWVWHRPSTLVKSHLVTIFNVETCNPVYNSLAWWLRILVDSCIRPALACDPAKIFLTSKFSYLLFSNSTHKTKTETAHRSGRILILTNHLDRPLWFANQKQGPTVLWSYHIYKALLCLLPASASCEKMLSWNHFAEPNQHVLTFLRTISFAWPHTEHPLEGEEVCKFWGLPNICSQDPFWNQKNYLYIPEGQNCSINWYYHLTGSVLENWNSWVKWRSPTIQKLRVQRRNYYLLRWTVKEDRACQWGLHACQSGTPPCKSSHWVSYRIVNIRW